jgi:hypothetical protein
MITDEKVKKLRRQLSRGIPEGEIRETMEREGYSQEDIQIVFVAPPRDMRSWYFSFSLIFFLLGLWLIMHGGSFLFLIFSAGMYFQYYREIQRLKRSNKDSASEEGLTTTPPAE